MVVTEMKSFNGEMTKEQSSEVAKFYAGKTIFVTGGTGFMGKVLIEKLLYSCDVNKIYMLVRDKKGLNVQQRTEVFFDDVVFEKVKAKKPDVLKKIIPIPGDLAAENIGFDQQLIAQLISDVSIVFHAAATIKFLEPIRKALSINVHGTQQVLSLCQKMKQLKAFVHVSTAYTNTDQTVVEEKVYPPPMKLDDVLEYIKTKDTIEDTLKLIGDRPNTYTFTKAIAEYEVLTKTKNIPACIVRPAIVLSVYKHPLPGWVDNWNGPTPLLYSAAQGYLRFLPGIGANNFNIVPADIACNGAIVAATRCQKSKDLKVYNYGSQTTNPITWGNAFVLFKESAVKRGLNILPYPGVIWIKNKIVLKILQFLFFILPALIMDLGLLVAGKTPRYYKQVKLTILTADVASFFIHNQWKFRDDNVQEMARTMSPIDQQVFYCNPADIHWETYMDIFNLGIRKFLLQKLVL